MNLLKKGLNSVINGAIHTKNVAVDGYEKVKAPIVEANNEIAVDRAKYQAESDELKGRVKLAVEKAVQTHLLEIGLTEQLVGKEKFEARKEAMKERYQSVIQQTIMAEAELEQLQDETNKWLEEEGQELGKEVGSSIETAQTKALLKKLNAHLDKNGSV